VIVGEDGAPVAAAKQDCAVLARTSAGDPVELSIMRDGEISTRTATPDPG